MRKRQKRTMIGGQALIEGLMMKGPEETCLAVRKPNGEIYTEVTRTKKSPVRKIPFVRGVAAMIQNMSEGMSHITKSADIAFPDAEEDESKFDKWVREKLGGKALQIVGGISMVLAVGIAIVLFMLAPIWAVNLLARIPALTPFFEINAMRALVEGLIKIFFFIAYLFAVTRMKDIHRVFEYHGAEHKTIMTYEYGDELTVENVKKHSRFHPRCGTSFIFIVLIVSIIIFSFISWGTPLVRAGLKLLALPVVMGISYEIIMLAGKYDNIFCRMLSAPGLWVQRLTTFEPDEGEIEVAITAFKAVLPADEKEPEEKTETLDPKAETAPDAVPDAETAPSDREA
jgi:Predicted metal-dependent enzyme